MSEQNNDPRLDSGEEQETPEFSEQELNEALAYVEASEMPPSIKNLILKCLKCISTVNSILSRQKMSIYRLRLLFGIKTEKKSLLPPSTPIPRRQRLLKMLAKRVTAATPTKTTQGPNKS